MSPAPRRQCGAMQLHERLSEEVASYRDNVRRLSEYTARAIETGVAQRAARRLIRIPTVVHVVYKRDAENITKAQITSQLDVLNRDFRAKNSDGSAIPTPWSGLLADAKIEFRLTRRDPDGKVTDGITRTKTNVAGFLSNDDMKRKGDGGVAAWNTRRYLNIWVCNLVDYLGYGQFPGGPARTDGVVIRHSAFGTKGTVVAPFNLGRTATHEVGHWLNLRHIWADTDGCGGSDGVSDTPNAALPNYGKPAWPHISCNNGPNGDMFMNYMDYVDDDSMFMFTPGQVMRMNACLAGPRKRLVRR
jgi:Pregnancy-associated plasma protein-A